MLVPDILAVYRRCRVSSSSLAPCQTGYPGSRNWKRKGFIILYLIMIENYCFFSIKRVCFWLESKRVHTIYKNHKAKKIQTRPNRNLFERRRNVWYTFQRHRKYFALSRFFFWLLSELQYELQKICTLWFVQFRK